MTVLSPPSPPPNIKFGRFLFATIHERDDLSLTVLSALTRLDLDPWQEAARLSELPEEEAINSLAATIWKSNSAFLTADEAAARASQLIGLLPPRNQAPPNTTVEEANLSVLWMVYAIFIGMMAASNQSQQVKITDMPPHAVALHQSEQARPFNKTNEPWRERN